MLFDGEAFFRHRRSGITRYLSELIHEFRTDPAMGIDPVTPYRWVTNRHLTEGWAGYSAVPLPRALRPRVLPWLNARHSRELEPVDLVHHSLYEERALRAWRTRRRICNVYDFTFERFPELAGDASAHLAAKAQFLERCDAVICISQTTRDDLSRFHPGLDKSISVIPLGVGERFFESRPTRIPRLPERYLLYVGNRHRHKNVDLLLQAFAEVSEQDADLHLVLAGAHLADENARRRARDRGRTLRLKVSDRALPWLYRRAEAFVFPSLYEGFGLPVLEAMAAGCPVAVSDADALLEVASDAALVFRPDDPGMLAGQIERLLADRALADQLREAGRRRASEFTWRRTAALTAAAYDRVISA